MAAPEIITVLPTHFPGCASCPVATEMAQKAQQNGRPEETASIHVSCGFYDGRTRMGVSYRVPTNGGEILHPYDAKFVNCPAQGL